MPEMTRKELIKELNESSVANSYQRWVLTLDGSVAKIDAYVVCNAYYFSAQVDHAVKKLLALGTRSGGKTVIQDLLEARNQLDMEIQRQQSLESPE